MLVLLVMNGMRLFLLQIKFLNALLLKAGKG